MMLLNNFLKSHVLEDREFEGREITIAFLAMLDRLSQTNPKVAEGIIGELRHQRNSLKLIASENYCSLDVQLAMGNWLTDKYAEGSPFHRFYAGCEHVDLIEAEGVELLKNLFGAECATVQPHSGADANLIAYWATLVHRVEAPEIERLGKKNINGLSPEEYEEIRRTFSQHKIMGMDLNCGGHLTHAARVNISAKMMKPVTYGVNAETGLIDYEEVRKIAKRERPTILLAGYSAYPRLLDFSIMREIADEARATLIVDMAHFAGLVAGGVLTGNQNPVPFADMVTSTTHKTLRGPRGGIVLAKEKYKKYLDGACPLVMGGPLPHVMAAKAVAFREASQPEFRTYAAQVVANAQALAERLMERGVPVLTGGTDNHMVIFNVQEGFGISGRQAEKVLADAEITVNRNAVPFDTNGPWYTSGVRIGTPALTTRGLKEPEMKKVADFICSVLRATTPKLDPKTGSSSKAQVDVDGKVIASVKGEIHEFLNDFPLYPEIAMV